MICVSPRRPGCHFDEWIPIVPGGYGALALSLAHVLVRDGLVDGEFLRDSVSGFSAWRDQAGVEQPGFEVLIRAAYAPDQTQDVTGIAAATVERLAHALAKQRPVAVASDGSATAHGHGHRRAQCAAREFRTRGRRETTKKSPSQLGDADGRRGRGRR